MRVRLLHLLAAVLCCASASCSTPLEGLTERPETSEFRLYPLSTCLVTDEELESKGGAIVRYYQGQEIKVCCQPCLNTFKANPEAFMARIR